MRYVAMHVSYKTVRELRISGDFVIKARLSSLQSTDTRFRGGRYNTILYAALPNQQ